MLRLDECAGRPEAGAKAERLARARASGLPVLDGFVILDGESPADETLQAALDRLGVSFIVRSSSSAEDGSGVSAAGVFESVANVSGLDNVKLAIARVRQSVAGAREYLSARGVGEQATMAVLIQPMSRASRFGVAMSADGGWRVEERRAGEPEWGEVVARQVSRDEPLGNILDAAEKFLGGPVDVEYDDGPTIFQIRPRMSGPLESLAAQFADFTEPGRWRLDAEHNPRPLSPAQAKLVELADALLVGARQRVVAGYLYVEVGAPRVMTPFADLRQRFDNEIAPDCRARMTSATDLASALDAFLHMIRRHVTEVSPAISRARHELDELLQGEPHGALLGGVGGAALRRDQALWDLAHDKISLDEYLRQFAAWAPAWDVAVPTDGESPERVWANARALPVEPRVQQERAARAAQDRANLLRQRVAALDSLLPLVRAAVEVGEDDDALFFEGQALVRRHLLAFPDLLTIPAEHTLPPQEIVDGQAQHPLPNATRVLQGHATSGRARGRARVLTDFAQAPPTLDAGAILVVPAILPSLAYLLPQCRALVTEHGGANSHGATLAREYGVPAVLGARGSGQIADGAELIVDGAAGRVYLL